MARIRGDHIGVVPPATLLLLAGGESRRMGQPKSLLPVEGATLLEWLAGRLAPGFEQVLVAARDPLQLPESLRDRFVADRHPGAGPLAGVEAGLESAGGRTVVAVACDMPYLSSGLLGCLLEAASGCDAAVPESGGRLHPACAAYRPTALARITAALEEGRRRALDVLAELDYRRLRVEDERLLTNLNTPEDYRDFLAQLPKTR
jgi:molybdopterin-guanine dinucleotide biosynthesis protein A